MTSKIALVTKPCFFSITGEIRMVKYPQFIPFFHEIVVVRNERRSMSKSDRRRSEFFNTVLCSRYHNGQIDARCQLETMEGLIVREVTS